MTGRRFVATNQITADEIPYLKAFGAALREARQAAGIGRVALTAGAGISTAHWKQLTAGNRRTKRSTLSRLVAIMAEGRPDLDAAELFDRLVEIAGPAIVRDEPGPLTLPAPTWEEVERLRRLWWSHLMRAERYRRQAAAIEARYVRLNGGYPDFL